MDWGQHKIGWRMNVLKNTFNCCGASFTDIFGFSLYMHMRDFLGRYLTTTEITGRH
jgi:hypothetical protein